MNRFMYIQVFNHPDVASHIFHLSILNDVLIHPKKISKTGKEKKKLDFVWLLEILREV